MKFSGNTLMASLGLAATLVFSMANANAAIDISHAPVALDFLDGTTDFGSSFRNNQANNTFADQFTFTLTAPHLMETYLSSISSSANNGLAITDFTVRSQGGSIVAHGVQESAGAIDLWSIYGVNLGPGQYYLQVNGYVVSNAGGSFGANINVTPVPEPESWAMMLGGLSVLVAIARRRQQKAAA